MAVIGAKPLSKCGCVSQCSVSVAALGRGLRRSPSTTTAAEPDGREMRLITGIGAAMVYEQW